MAKYEITIEANKITAVNGILLDERIEYTSNRGQGNISITPPIWLRPKTRAKKVQESPKTPLKNVRKMPKTPPKKCKMAK